MSVVGRTLSAMTPEQRSLIPINWLTYVSDPGVVAEGCLEDIGYVVLSRGDHYDDTVFNALWVIGSAQDDDDAFTAPFTLEADVLLRPSLLPPSIRVSTDFDDPYEQALNDWWVSKFPGTRVYAEDDLRTLKIDFTPASQEDIPTTAAGLLALAHASSGVQVLGDLSGANGIAQHRELWASVETWMKEPYGPK